MSRTVIYCRTRTQSQETPNPNHIKRKQEFLLEGDASETGAKKGKIISLLDAVSNGNLKDLKRLAKTDGEKVNITGEFFFKNGRQFKNITPIFAAILSDKYDMVKFLLKFLPHIDLKKETMKEDADFDMEIIIDSYQLIGAVCLFEEDTEIRNHGMILWRKAFELLSGHGLTTSNFVPSTITVLAFGENSEIKTESGLEDMEDDKRPIQCLLVIQRISMKYNCLPSNYVALKVYDFALKNWKTKHLEPSRVFYTCIYLIETIEPININKRKWFDVVFRELIEVLKDKRWNPTVLSQQNTVLTFDNLLKILRFDCAHLINAYSNRAYYQAHKLLIISDSILQILRLLMSCTRTEEPTEADTCSKLQNV